MGLMFFPRGGSAHVARNLAHGAARTRAGTSTIALRLALAARAARRRARVLPRPRRAPGRLDAPRSTAPDPLLADPPLHPSYEDRPGAPDRVFASLDDDAPSTRSRPGRARCRPRARADADVLHLHHLTPLNEAARASRRDVPVVGHLHGTELLMLEAIEARRRTRWPHARGVGGAHARAGRRAASA